MSSQRLILLIMLLNSCVDPFSLSQVEVPQLVIEGQITDQPGPYEIKISQAILQKSIPVRGAEVTVRDDLNRTLNFGEQAPGIYISDQGAPKGEIGRTYLLEIQLIDGTQYCSLPETMVAVPSINEINVVPARRSFVSDQGNDININGFEVVVSPASNRDQGTYLRWEYRGVYALRTPAPCDDCTKTCWFESRPPPEYLRITGTQRMNSPMPPVALDFFLGSQEFDTAYIIRVKQFSLNARAFEFWQSVQAQRTSSGSIFDPVPGAITGNMEACGASSEPVAGYFMASAVHLQEHTILKEDLAGFDLNFELPLLECFRNQAGPAYCNDCLQLPDSFDQIPESSW